jgi:hypothetical protein
MSGKKMVSAGVCPWCQSPLNAGAMACKSCGASESNGWEQAGAWRYSIVGLFMAFLTLPGAAIVYFFPVTGLALLILGIGGLIVVRRMMKRSRSWVASGARAVV